MILRAETIGVPANPDRGIGNRLPVRTQHNSLYVVPDRKPQLHLFVRRLFRGQIPLFLLSKPQEQPLRGFRRGACRGVRRLCGFRGTVDSEVWPPGGSRNAPCHRDTALCGNRRAPCREVRERCGNRFTGRIVVAREKGSFTRHLQSAPLGHDHLQND